MDVLRGENCGDKGDNSHSSLFVAGAVYVCAYDLIDIVSLVFSVLCMTFFMIIFKDLTKNMK